MASDMNPGHAVSSYRVGACFFIDCRWDNRSSLVVQVVMPVMPHHLFAVDLELTDARFATSSHKEMILTRCYPFEKIKIHFLSRQHTLLKLTLSRNYQIPASAHMLIVALILSSFTVLF